MKYIFKMEFLPDTWDIPRGGEKKRHWIVNGLSRLQLGLPVFQMLLIRKFRQIIIRFKVYFLLLSVKFWNSKIVSFQCPTWLRTLIISSTSPHSTASLPKSPHFHMRSRPSGISVPVLLPRSWLFVCFGSYIFDILLDFLLFFFVKPV